MLDPRFRGKTERVVAIINNKGGVGKSTLTANLGGLLGHSGWRVLLVDLDHQGNLGLDYGYRDTAVDDDGKALSKAINYGEAPTPINVRPNVDVLMGGSHLELIRSSITPGGRRNGGADPRLTIAEMLVALDVDSKYDIVLIDCPPSNEEIQAAAVAAARYVLIPVKTDKASLEGLILTANRLQQVIDINPTIDLLGIVLFDSTTSAVKVREVFKSQIIQSLIADDAGEAERSLAEATIFKSFVRHAEAPAARARDAGLLMHELDVQVKKEPTFLDRLRARGKSETPPLKKVQIAATSAGGVADDFESITKEFVARLSAAEERNVGEGVANV